MKFVIETIPHSAQRHETVGDWWQDAEGVHHITISELNHPRLEALIALHEFVEYLLCYFRGIREVDVSAFDCMFEEERSRGLHGDEDEPGHDPRAPYRREHRFAECVERLLAHELNVDWQQYDAIVTGLSQT